MGTVSAVTNRITLLLTPEFGPLDVLLTQDEMTASTASLFLFLVVFSWSHFRIQEHHVNLDGC